VRGRAAKGHTVTTTVVAIDDAKIAGAQLTGATAHVAVRFASKLASVTKDSAGAVVEGSATEVTDHVDLWTFDRDVRSRDPNWRLTETQSET
jgi:predicted lipid-binding transport protein (Tim44 family)